MIIAEKLKDCSLIRRVVKKHKIRIEFKNDYKQFSKYYMDSFDGQKQLEYRILFIAHSLEKGMTHKKMRPFGDKKVKDMLKCLKRIEEMRHSNAAFMIGVGIMVKWKNLYDYNHWPKTDTYYEVEEYIFNQEGESLPCGSEIIDKDEIKKYYNFDYLDAIKTRHSTRDYEEKKIADSDIEYCVKCAISSPSACNRQMCHLYYIDNSKKTNRLSLAIKGLTGFNKKTVNFFVVTYDIPAFLFSGERNQGYFNAGLFSMNFVNALHFKGIGSCFLQWANCAKEEKDIKKMLNIPEEEKIAVIIAAGYYKEQSVIPISFRKKIEEVYKIVK